MAAHSAIPVWLVPLAARWKAMAALAGSLTTALLVVFPTSHVLQVAIAVIGALITGGLTHQVPNLVVPVPLGVNLPEAPDAN